MLWEVAGDVFRLRGSLVLSGTAGKFFDALGKVAGTLARSMLWVTAGKLFDALGPSMLGHETKKKKKKNGKSREHS